MFLVLFVTSSSFAQVWQFTGEISSPRRHMSANVLLDGTVFIAGGCDATNVSLTICERYNPQTETWSPAASLTIPRIQHTTHLLPTGEVIAIAVTLTTAVHSVATNAF